MTAQFSRPTSFGFTIRMGRSGQRLHIRHDATGETRLLADALPLLTRAELVGCGRACQRAYEATGEIKYAAAAHACRKLWKGVA